MPYRRLKLFNLTTPIVPEPTASALELIDIDTPHDTLLALDTFVASRRVLARLGLDGGKRFVVPDGTSPTSGSQVYPDNTTPRVALRLEHVELTPGSLVRMDVLWAPAGPTQRSDGGGGWELDEVAGSVRATITYRSPDAEENEAIITLEAEPSEEPNGAEPGNVIGSLARATKLAVPTIIDDDPAEWSKWTRPGVECDVVLEVIGSPRIVDVALVEQPWSTTSELADEWAGPLYGDDDGNPHPQPIHEWPQTQASTDDRGDGIVAIAEAIATHGDQLGPVLVAWSSANEGDSLADWQTDDEAVPFIATGTSQQQLVSGEELSSTSSAWATGSHGAPLVQSGDDALARRTAVLPVWIWAYMRVAGTGTGYLRVATSDWDSYTLETTSLAWEAKRVPGWLEVGTAPEDQRQLRAHAYASVGGLDVETRYVLIQRRRSTGP